jgi:hypothetical protein
MFVNNRAVKRTVSNGENHEIWELIYGVQAKIKSKLQMLLKQTCVTYDIIQHVWLKANTKTS